MSKIEALKKLIKEQSRMVEKRERILQKVGGYEHVNNVISEMIVAVTKEDISLEDVNNFFEQEDTKQLMK